MAKITAVKVNYGLTANLGNYESLRIDIELAADISTGESTEKMLDSIKKMAKIKVQQYIKEHDNGV